MTNQTLPLVLQLLFLQMSLGKNWYTLVRHQINSWSMFRRKVPSPVCRDSQYGRSKKALKTHSALPNQDGICLSFKPWPAHNSSLFGNSQLYIFHINSNWPLFICTPPSNPAIPVPLRLADQQLRIDLFSMNA